MTGLLEITEGRLRIIERGRLKTNPESDLSLVLTYLETDAKFNSSNQFATKGLMSDNGLPILARLQEALSSLVPALWEILLVFMFAFLYIRFVFILPSSSSSSSSSSSLSSSSSSSPQSPI
ncbi:hypothetical protein GQX74_008980 [Glossina fuscipes]|nr:hypothetical protein GQX74_008980 [Glossina fuscipes]